MTILGIAYCITALGYLLSAAALLLFPEKMKVVLRKLFPLLESFQPSILLGAICLTLAGTVLFVVGSGFVIQALWGLFVAFVLSVWEIFLAFGFYLPRRETWNAAGHVVLHVFIAILIANVVSLHHAGQMDDIKTRMGASAKEALAAIGVLDSDRVPRI